MAEETSGSDLLELATELTMAWLSNPNTRAAAEDVPAFLQSMHGAVTNLVSPSASQETAAPATEYTPAVTPRRSLSSPDHIISMIDGKPYKTLKRHLSGHGLTPAEYRERYGLKPDYPMVATNYAEMRRSLAKKIGLGRKAGTTVAPKSVAKPASKPATDKSATVPAKAKPATKPAAVKSAPKRAAKPKAPAAVKPAAPETATQS